MKRGARVWKWFNVGMIAGTAVLFAASTISARSVARISSFQVRADVLSLAFSGDESQIAVALHERLDVAVPPGARPRRSGAVSIASIRGDEVARFSTSDLAWNPVFSGNGQAIVASNIKRTTVLTLDGTPGRELPGLHLTARSENGRFIAGIGEDSFRMLDLATGNVRDLGPRSLSKAQFTPNGKQLMAIDSISRKLRIWDVESGQPVDLPNPLKATQFSAATISTDGQVVGAVYGHGSLNIFVAATGAPARVTVPGRIGLERVDRLRFLDTGRFLFAEGRVMSPNGPRPGHQVWDLSGMGRNWLFTGDRRLEAVSSNGLCALRESVTGARWSQFLNLHRSRTPRSLIQTTLLDLRTGREWVLRDSGGFSRSITFSPSGSLLAVGATVPPQLLERDGFSRFVDVGCEVAIYRLPRR